MVKVRIFSFYISVTYIWISKLLPGVVSFTNLPPPPVLTRHLPTYNILSRHPPLPLGTEVQLCWLLPLTLEPSA